MEPVVMEPTVTEPVVMEPTLKATAGPSPGRDRSGEGKGQRSYEHQTEDLLHDRLLLDRKVSPPTRLTVAL